MPVSKATRKKDDTEGERIDWFIRIVILMIEEA